MSAGLRLLLVEDSVADAELAMIELRRSGFDVAAERVDDAAGLAAALTGGPYDLVLCDHGLPGFSSTEALALIRARDPDVPVVILSGTIGEEAAIAALKDGAMDVVVKTNLPRLGVIAERELREAANRREHRAAEAALRDAEHSYRMVFQCSPLAMLCYDASSGAILDVNDAAVGLYGYGRGEFAAMTIAGLTTAPRGAAPQVTGEPDGATPGRARHFSKDGRELEIATTVHAVRFGDRDACFMIADDVGERESLARQLRQSQRLESLGELAGGVAHDFNNLLGVIMSYTGFVKEDLAAAAERDRSRWDRSLRDISQVEEAVERAVRMTRQLLLFSRREVIQAAVVDVNEVVTDIYELLSRTLGERIELTTRMAEELVPITIDPGQLEQVLVNLAVNARDAMPDGGTIHIDTENVVADARFRAANRTVRGGRYARLRVSDTGPGMDERTLDRAFEPFFTTKPKGQGTGLGLATVYGIVTRAGGHVTIESAPGRGTIVSVLLPATTGVRAAQPVARSPERQQGRETILLVEDERALREVTARMLSRNGYTVLAAADGPEAVELSALHRGQIDLLLTDVIMPDLTGPDVAARITAARPDIRVLFVSGYADPQVGPEGVLAKEAALLDKPFTEAALLAKIRALLDAE